MRGRCWVAVLLLLLSGCAAPPVDAETDAPDDAAEAPVPLPDAVGATNAPPGAIEGRATGPIPYSCEPLGEMGAPAAPAHALTGALLVAAPIASFGRVSAPDRVASLLRDAEREPLEAFSSRDRILIQASALRVWRSERELASTAAAVVKRMALDARALAELGSDPRSELEPWLGSAEGWVERKGPSCGPLGAHDAAFAGALAFRTVRAGAKRVLFAQVVALDSDLRPHVTPVVGLIELRSGMQADAPACVLEATPAGLATVPFDALHASPFVIPEAGESVGCNNCHNGQGPGDLADLGREEGGAFRIERRLALLDHAEGRTKELRRVLGAK